MNITGTVCRCLRPRKIVNPYTSQELIVPCGHCEACRLNRNQHLTLLCDLEKEANKYCVFVTLTYANRFIPRAKLIDSLERSYAYDLVSDDGELLGTFDMSEDYKESLLKKIYLFDSVPYLRKTDLQKFFKRFRYYAKKSTKEKIRYFACGEYGPVHFRPHFHVLFYFNDPQTLQVCEQAVLSAWPFGRVDVQISSGKTSSYVAGYVNSACNLPEIFKVPATRPFSVHSNFLGQSVLAREREKVYASSALDFIRTGLAVNGKYTEFNLWRSYYAAYFPKCKGYFDKSSRERLDSYLIYGSAKQVYYQEETVIDIARAIAFDLFMLPDSSSLSEEERFVYNFFKRSNIGTCESLDSDEGSLFVQRIYTQLLLSKHFMQFVCERPTIAEAKRKLKLIENFYTELDYLHLKDFFETQSAFFDSDLYGEESLYYKDDNAYYPYFYDNVDVSYDNLSAVPAFRCFTQKTLELYNSKMKHKRLNDLNKMFCDN